MKTKEEKKQLKEYVTQTMKKLYHSKVKHLIKIKNVMTERQMDIIKNFDFEIQDEIEKQLTSNLILVLFSSVCVSPRTSLCLK